MLPNMSNVIKSYMQKITLVKVTKTIINYEETEVHTEINTRGVRQPVDPQKLQIMSEGQRGWKWECLHLLPNVDLKPDDIVIYKQNKYRVIEKYDFTEYGYIEFMIAQTFEDDEESS